MMARHMTRALVGFLFFVSAGAVNNAAAQNWDGGGLVRFGVFLQGSLTDLNITQTPQAAPAFRQTASPDGIGVGIAAGYDLRMGSFIIGAEIDGSFDDGGDKPTNAFLAEQYGIDYFATLRGRLGYFVHPGFLVYGTVGYGLLGTEYKLSNATALGLVTGTGNKKYATMDGLVYGGGLEYDIGWGTLFGEYLHSDLGDWSFRSFSGNAIKVESSSDVFRLGMKFKVGHDYDHDTYKRYDPVK